MRPSGDQDRQRGSVAAGVGRASAGARHSTVSAEEAADFRIRGRAPALPGARREAMELLIPSTLP
jgi:hypothetical protein